MARRTHDTKRGVVEFLERVGEASPVAIGAALGIPPEEQHALQQLLGRMVRRGVLVRSAHGSYSLSPHHQIFAFDNFHLTERGIERYLVERCGVADTGDIANAVCARRLDYGTRDGEHKRLTTTLKESPKFCQDFGSGRWCLTRDARERLPLLGKWADLEIQLAWFERMERDGFDGWEAKRAGFFRRVGEAFEEARDEFSLVEAVNDPGIAAALDAIGDRAHDARRELLYVTQDELEAEARAANVAVWEYVEARQAERLRLNLLAAFERGDVSLHLVAPPEFYRGAAALYGVDAARLSRGEVVALSADRGDLRVGVDLHA